MRRGTAAADGEAGDARRVELHQLRGQQIVGDDDGVVGQADARGDLAGRPISTSPCSRSQRSAARAMMRGSATPRDLDIAADRHARRRRRWPGRRFGAGGGGQVRIIEEAEVRPRQYRAPRRARRPPAVGPRRPRRQGASGRRFLVGDVAGVHATIPGPPADGDADSQARRREHPQPSGKALSCGNQAEVARPRRRRRRRWGARSVEASAWPQGRGTSATAAAASSPTRFDLDRVARQTPNAMTATGLRALARRSPMANAISAPKRPASRPPSPPPGGREDRGRARSARRRWTSRRRLPRSMGPRRSARPPDAHQGLAESHQPARSWRSPARSPRR